MLFLQLRFFTHTHTLHIRESLSLSLECVTKCNNPKKREKRTITKKAGANSLVSFFPKNASTRWTVSTLTLFYFSYTTTAAAAQHIACTLCLLQALKMCPMTMTTMTSTQGERSGFHFVSSNCSCLKRPTVLEAALFFFASRDHVNAFVVCSQLRRRQKRPSIVGVYSRTRAVKRDYLFF